MFVDSGLQLDYGVNPPAARQLRDGQRGVGNFVEFVAEGRGSRALAVDKICLYNCSFRILLDFPRTRYGGGTDRPMKTVSTRVNET